MGWFYPEYVPVAQRIKNAQKKIEKLQKKGKNIVPLIKPGRKITTTFWGNSWCNHIESFSDYESRLARGRTLVRNGSVCHLEILNGKVNAMVAGSELYNINITIKNLNNSKWLNIKNFCSGKIGSILDLLSGNLSDSIMNIVCDQNSGLFPLPGEIELDCSCPDWAVMCKHVAAVLYGVGVRLESEPAEIFKLRGVNYEELIDISQAVTDIINTQGKSKRLSLELLSSVFDIEFDEQIHVENLQNKTLSKNNS